MRSLAVSQNEKRRECVSRNPPLLRRLLSTRCLPRASGGGKISAAKIIQVTLQNFLNVFFRTFYTICVIFPLNKINRTKEQYFLNIFNLFYVFISTILIFFHTDQPIIENFFVVVARMNEQA